MSDYEVLEVPTVEEGVVLNLNDPKSLRGSLGKPWPGSGSEDSG